MEVDRAACSPFYRLLEPGPPWKVTSALDAAIETLALAAMDHESVENAKRDIAEVREEDEDGVGEGEERPEKPRELPADLPRSLDDRQNFSSFEPETEYYDAWQGRKAICIPCHTVRLTRTRAVAIPHSTNICKDAELQSVAARTGR